MLVSEKFLTPDDVAERLRVSVRTVWEWLRTGRLRSYRAGNLYRISEEHLQEFLEGSARRATGQEGGDN